MNIIFLYFPYCLRQLTDDSWIVLNRHYKPLGLPDECGWVNYEEFPTFKVELTPEKLAHKLSSLAEDRSGSKHIWLYNAVTAPFNHRGFFLKNWAQYAKKLQALAQLRIQPTHKWALLKRVRLTYEVD